MHVIQDDRLAIPRRQRHDDAPELGDSLGAGRRGERVIRAGGLVGNRGVERHQPAVAPETVPRQVAGHAVEIRRQPGSLRVVAPESPHQDDKGLLRDVLRDARRPGHQPREPEDRRAVADVDGRERLALARRGAPDQLHIGRIGGRQVRHLRVIVTTGRKVPVVCG